MAKQPLATAPVAPPEPAPTWLRRMRFRHLEVLLAISRHNSLTAAAAALDITQPAVSQWLADIEAAAGVRLFVRGQRLRPTPFAAPLIQHAERVLNDAQRAIGEVHALRAGGVGSVRLGAMQVAAASLVPAVVLQLQRDAPDIALTLIEDGAAGLWARFQRNELDVLVTRLDARALASGLPQQRLFSDPHRVVCRAQHPLLSRRRLGWRDVARYPWVLPTPGTPLRQAVELTFATAGVPLPRVLLASVSPSCNPVLIQQSDALAAMSGGAAAQLQAQGLLSRLPLALTHDIGDVGLVWRDAKPGPAVAALLQAFAAANERMDTDTP